MEANQTNFDKYLERKLADPGFREQFVVFDRAWDIALQLVALRRERSLTQEQVAELIGTKQQAIARLENPAYTRHSPGMINRYAEALGATVDVTIVPSERLAEYTNSDCSKPLLDGLPAWRGLC